MRRDFFPDREADMVSWGLNMAKQLMDRPGHFGVSLERVQQFVALAEDFHVNYKIVQVPVTRTTVSVSQKNTSRRAMEREARKLSRFITGQPDVTDNDRISLRLTVPKTRSGHVMPPTSKPRVQVIQTDGSNVSIRLVDTEQSTRRARPDHADGAQLFVAYTRSEGDPIESWSYFTSTPKTKLTLQLNPLLPPGTRVWICARWKNRRCETGEMGPAVWTCLGYGVSLDAIGIPACYESLQDAA